MKMLNLQLENTHLSIINEELVFQRGEKSVILSDMTDTTYGATILLSAVTFTSAQDTIVTNTSIQSAQTFATAADITHKHGTNNTLIPFNYNGVLTASTNLAFNLTGQTLEVGKVKLTTGVVSSFQMKDVYSAVVYNVYLSGGTLTVATP